MGSNPTVAIMSKPSQYHLQRALWLEQWAVDSFDKADCLEELGDMTTRERYVNMGRACMRDSEAYLKMAIAFEKAGK